MTQRKQSVGGFHDAVQVAVALKEGRRIPADLARSGCGYAVSLRRGVSEASELLKRNGLWTGRLFRREDDGDYREVLP